MITKDIKFLTIDYWSRPVYKATDSNVLIGSVDVLFPDKNIAPNNTTKEINDYFRNHLDKLVIFGTDIEDDPLGYRIGTNIKLNIID